MGYIFKIYNKKGQLIRKGYAKPGKKPLTLKEAKAAAHYQLYKKNIPKGSHSVVEKENNNFLDFGQRYSKKKSNNWWEYY